MAIGALGAIGLGISALGGVLSSSSSNKAVSKAADVSTQNTAQNTALAREIYGKNQQALAPFQNRGNAAGDQINALLGLGGAQQPQVQPNALSQFYGGMPAGAGYGIADGQSGLGSRFLQMRSGDPNEGLAFTSGFAPAISGAQQSPNAVMAGQLDAQGAANNAFDIFRNSTGYQFRLGQGLDAINSGYAGAGTLQSGAAMKAINEYGQNFASNEFGNYLGALQSQQAVGAGAASSLAGVGQNFAGTVINANNMNAANQGNALLARGANNPLANAFGIIGGGILGAGG